MFTSTSQGTHSVSSMTWDKSVTSFLAPPNVTWGSQGLGIKSCGFTTVSSLVSVGRDGPLVHNLYPSVFMNSWPLLAFNNNQVVLVPKLNIYNTLGDHRTVLWFFFFSKIMCSVKKNTNGVMGLIRKACTFLCFMNKFSLNCWTAKVCSSLLVLTFLFNRFSLQ